MPEALPTCPHCGSRNTERIERTRVFFCQCCAKQFEPRIRFDADQNIGPDAEADY